MITILSSCVKIDGFNVTDLCECVFMGLLSLSLPASPLLRNLPPHGFTAFTMRVLFPVETFISVVLSFCDSLSRQFHSEYLACEI